MSERKKLEEDFLYKRRLGLTCADFIIAFGKLVENCKHEKTRWIQEIHQDGTFSNILVKRCYVCGVNITAMEVEPKFINKLLNHFDKACEKKRGELKEND